SLRVYQPRSHKMICGTFNPRDCHSRLFWSQVVIVFVPSVRSSQLKYGDLAIRKRLCCKGRGRHAIQGEIRGRISVSLNDEWKTASRIIVNGIIECSCPGPPVRCLPVDDFHSRERDALKLRIE